MRTDVVLDIGDNCQYMIICKREITIMKPVLTVDELIQAAKLFCEIESKENHVEIIGVTDGKAVGTYVEHRFQNFLQSKYKVEIGNSARGIDLPGADIQTDIKVTSITQPQLRNLNQVVLSEMRVKKFLGLAIICLSLYMTKRTRATRALCILSTVHLYTKSGQQILPSQSVCVK